MEKIYFTLTVAHLKLLPEMNISWQDIEASALCVDPKRPYGNGDHLGDIADILGIKKIETYDGDSVLSKKDGEYCDKLHKETQRALEVVLNTRRFLIGEYEKPKYGGSWKLTK